MFSKIETSTEVHPLIADRWSPKLFSHEPIDRDSLTAMLEAARLAPSWFNEQPVSFIIGDKFSDEDQYQRLLRCFTESNQAWAQHAPVLMFTIAKLYSNFNGIPNPWAFHDVGLAVANLTFQARSEEIFVSEVAGIYPDKVHESFNVPEGYAVCSALVIGYMDETTDLPDNIKAKHYRERNRRPLEKFYHTGEFTDYFPLDETRQQNYHELRDMIRFGRIESMTKFMDEINSGKYG